MGTRTGTGELFPDRSPESYPLKQKVALGTQGSCSQLFHYIHCHEPPPCKVSLPIQPWWLSSFIRQVFHSVNIGLCERWIESRLRHKMENFLNKKENISRSYNSGCVLYGYGLSMVIDIDPR